MSDIDVFRKQKLGRGNSLRGASLEVTRVRPVHACLALLLALALSSSSVALTPPPTPRHEVEEVIHGVKIVDPYRWLEDRNSPETEAWIQAQNNYRLEVLGKVKGRARIRQLVSQLARHDTYSMPLHRDDRYFFARRKADQELSTMCMRKGLQGEDIVLIDPHPLSPDHTTSVHLLDVADDGSLLVYGIREGGEDEIAMKIFDVERRHDLGDSFPKARYSSINITPDAGGFYYSIYSDEGERVKYHRIGTSAEGDKLVFGEGFGPGIGIDVDLSDDGRFLLFTVYHGSAARKTEVYFIDLEKGGGIRTVVNDIDASFVGEVGGTCLYLKTDWNSPNGRIIVVDLENPVRSAWREVVPETEEVIEDFALADGYLLVRTLDNVVPSIKVFKPDGELVRRIEVPAPGYVSLPRGRWTDKEAFFTYSSFHIPTVIYRYDLKDFTKSVWAKVDAPIKSEDFELKQVWYTSKDGTRVSMFVAHKRGLKLDGSRPTLLSGYGGFRVSLKPYFGIVPAAWLKLGGVCALANLRGGGELGERWHRDGMGYKKQNTFDDFIAAAQWLIDNGYTNPEKLAIMGGSNGGLLVGAALTQRPDLFKAVICSYPLLDMIRYHKFLVAKFWIPEYGSSEDADQFRYLLSYSPYHNVRPGEYYPAVLFVTGDADTRVDPLHARKMTALLQASTASTNPILLHYDTRAGHSGGKPTSKYIDDVTEYLLFLAWQLGMPLE